MGAERTIVEEGVGACREEGMMSEECGMVSVKKTFSSLLLVLEVFDV